MQKSTIDITIVYWSSPFECFIIWLLKADKFANFDFVNLFDTSRRQINIWKEKEKNLHIAFHCQLMQSVVGLFLTKKKSVTEKCSRFCYIIPKVFLSEKVWELVAWKIENLTYLSILFCNFSARPYCFRVFNVSPFHSQIHCIVIKLFPFLNWNFLKRKVLKAFYNNFS